MTYTYQTRQDNLIDKGMVEVSYIIHQRRGCRAVIGYEYFAKWANAVKRANCILTEKSMVLVCNFAGKCERFER